MPDSPRTDAAEFELHHTQAGAYMRKCANGGWVESDFARGLESENAKLARWILQHCDHWAGDHACAECFPGGGAIIPGFRCAVHVARSITEPANAPDLNVGSIK